MKPKLSVRAREKQRLVLMQGVAAADRRLELADQALLIMERQVRVWRAVALFATFMALVACGAAAAVLGGLA